MEPRLLILLTGVDAEPMLVNVLDFLGDAPRQANTAILMISHLPPAVQGPARTLVNGLEIIRLRTPQDRGNGGTQKLGFRYAVGHGFDVVACLSDFHGGFANFQDLLQPLVRGQSAAVLAMRRGRGSERALAFLQDRLLHIKIPAFQAGNRAYAVEALKKIPFERASDDIRFDTEIIIQLTAKGLRVEEIPAHGSRRLPVAFGPAFKILRAILRAAFHGKTLLYDRKFDVEAVEETYDLKEGFPSSHTFAIAAARPGARILDLGCGRGYVAREFAKKAERVTAIDRYEPGIEPASNLDFQRWDLDAGESPVDVSQYDQIFLLDIVEHLKDPEEFLERLRVAAARTRPEIILTTANIAFFVTRIMLLFGHFNYGRKGILDRTHTRLFTVNSLRELMEQTGYTIEEIRGIPAPYARVLGLNWMSRALAWLNGMLIGLSRGVFSYQIFVRARANPTVHNLLLEIEEG